MTTNAGHSFYIGPIDSFYNQVNDTGSWEPLVLIMVCYAEPVVVHHVVLYWVSGCESCCVMLSLWLWIKCFMLSQWLWFMVCYTEPVVVNHVVLCWASSFLIMVWYAETVVVNHGVLCLASDCESCRGMLNQWMWASGCESYVLYWGSGCESRWAILSQWLWIMLFSAVPVVVNYVVLCWASGCESCCVMLTQLFWIMVCYAEPVVVNYSE